MFDISKIQLSKTYASVRKLVKKTPVGRLVIFYTHIFELQAVVADVKAHNSRFAINLYRSVNGDFLSVSAVENEHAQRKSSDIKRTRYLCKLAEFRAARQGNDILARFCKFKLINIARSDVRFLFGEVYLYLIFDFEERNIIADNNIKVFLRTVYDLHRVGNVEVTVVRSGIDEETCDICSRTLEFAPREPAVGEGFKEIVAR